MCTEVTQLTVGRDRPRVSIGLPVYNGENYLEETLCSLLAQTYRDFELIISDNASTDRTPDICAQYAARDSRIHYSRNRVNIGVDRNFNLVFTLSRGEYFKWAAHDDLIAPEFLSRCVQVLDRDPAVIMCYPKTALIDETGTIIEYLEDGFNLRSAEPHVRFRQSFHACGWCHPAFGLIRSEVLRMISPMGGYAASDKVLLGELAIHGQCSEIPEYLAYLRYHPDISTLQYKTDAAIAAWIDPLASRRPLAPRLRRVRGHLESIFRSPHGWRVKLLCCLELARFYLARARVGGALREMQTAFGGVGRSILVHLGGHTCDS